MAGRHPITSPEQVAQTPPEISDAPLKQTDTTAAFGMVKLLPDIVDDIAESVGLEIDYGSFQLENAMEIGPGELSMPPDVRMPGAKSGAYTLALVDADAPSPHKPHYRSWLHWLVFNIPAVDVRRGEEVLPYEPPEPQAKGGKHRCAFLVFRQSGQLDASKATPKNRRGFQVRQWCTDHGLSPNPAAGMFFWAKSGKEA